MLPNSRPDIRVFLLCSPPHTRISGHALQPKNLTTRRKHFAVIFAFLYTLLPDFRMLGHCSRNMRISGHDVGCVSFEHAKVGTCLRFNNPQTRESRVTHFGPVSGTLKHANSGTRTVCLCECKDICFVLSLNMRKSVHKKYQHAKVKGILPTVASVRKRL